MRSRLPQRTRGLHRRAQVVSARCPQPSTPETRGSSGPPIGRRSRPWNRPVQSCQRLLPCCTGKVRGCNASATGIDIPGRKQQAPGPEHPPRLSLRTHHCHPHHRRRNRLRYYPTHCRKARQHNSMCCQATHPGKTLSARRPFHKGTRGAPRRRHRTRLTRPMCRKFPLRETAYPPYMA